MARSLLTRADISFHAIDGGGVNFCSSDGACDAFTVFGIGLVLGERASSFDRNINSFCSGAEFGPAWPMADCEVIVKWPGPFGMIFSPNLLTASRNSVGCTCEYLIVVRIVL